MQTTPLTISISASLFLSGACDSTEPFASTACPTAVACEDAESRRPELDPACNPALSSYRAENWRLPDGEEPAPKAESPHADTIVFSYRFGPDRKADGALTAWLEADQDLSVAFALAVGEDERAEGPITVVLLLDGKAAPVALADAEPKAFNELQLDDAGQASGTLTVASETLVSGASSANLLLTNGDGKALAQAAFTVLHGSAAFQERAEPVDEPKKAAVGSQVASVRREGDLRSLFATPPDADGNLPLTFVLTPMSTGSACTDVVHRGLLVGLLDHTPITLGDRGERLAFELLEGEAVELSIELRGLPIDGGIHLLEFWWLDGDGAYAEAPLGQFSAWHGTPKQLGYVRWGVDGE